MNLRTGIAAAAVAFSLAPAVSLAVDGVMLIDQNKALAGNVTAGDMPGYPVTISTPGSYRLSGNLTVPIGLNGIVFETDGITLDLNGFTIGGGGPGLVGLYDGGTSHSRLTVRNGQVTGFSNSVLMSSTHVVIEDLRLDPGGGGVAIVVGNHSRVSRNTVVGNGLIQVACPSILTENITDGFLTVQVGADPTKLCIRYHNRSIGFFGAINE